MMPRRAGKTGNEASQLEEVREPQERAPVAHHDLRIRGDHVRPLRWHGANSGRIDLQQKPFAIAVEAFAHASELLPTERMERVGHPHKALDCARNVCIPH
jgi:hypothetical protein